MRRLIDTISAISTPPGYGGISIVRMSGPDSITIAKTIFKPANNKQFSDIESHRMVHGFIIEPETGKRLDEVMLTVMQAPKSFTKEDIVEINCHGGLYITQSILDLTLVAGARLSEPGEFTRRAFLNGRITLTQAEGIIDLINSRSGMSHDAALTQIEGGLVQEISGIKKKLFAIALEVETEIDFSEEEIITRGTEKWIKEIEEINIKINTLSGTFDRGKILREGLTIAIIGRSNVGKSSLMNCLLGEERAIVSEIPGTTRDTIEERLSVNGLTVQLIDTAGIRKSMNPLELEGIKRSQRKINDADILILVFDGSEPLTEDDIALVDMAKNLKKHVIGVINKIDKKMRINEEQVKKGSNGFLFHISVHNKNGIDELINGISKSIWSSGERFKEDIIITRKRHFDLLVKAKTAIERGINVMRNGLQIELFAQDLKEGVLALDEMTGGTYTEELLDSIFSEFCIGK